MEEQLAYKCQNPVVLILFNRPDKTARLIQALKKVQPDKLYVVADGPRAHVPADSKLTAEVRRLVDEQVDWDCQLHKIYSEQNMSGPKRVPSAFDEIFALEQQVIILEDDCIPSVSFFRFCDELLVRYADDDRIGTICGFNLEFDFWGVPIEGNRDTSYFFSRYPASWGWATWRRVWQNFDYELGDFPAQKEAGLFERISDVSSVKRFWIKKFEGLYSGEKRNWDYKLCYSLIRDNQMSVIPNHCMVSNIGADGSGVNYTDKDYVSRKIAHKINFPLVHPDEIQIDEFYDQRVSGHFYNDSWLGKMMRIFRNRLR